MSYLEEKRRTRIGQSGRCRWPLSLAALGIAVLRGVAAAAGPGAGWSEDFSRGLEQWWTEGAEHVWVEDGRLRVWSDPTEPNGKSHMATVWCRRALPANFEFEADAHVESSASATNNINLFLSYSDPTGRPLEETRDTRQSADYKLYHSLNGYIVTFLNDKGRARVRLRRCPGFELLAETHAGECRTGVTYRLMVRKEGGTLAFSVDGKELARATDPRPWPGGLLGLRTYRTRLWCDNVVVRPIGQ